MQDEDAKAFISVLHSSIHEVANADYSGEVINSWAPEITDENVSFVLANPENELRIIAELNGRIVGIGAIVIERSLLRACYVTPMGSAKA